MAQLNRHEVLTKQRFHGRLRAWFKDTDDKTVGDPKATTLLYVRHGDLVFRLNADTQREGVAEYLALVDQYGDDLEWHAVSSESGRKTAVAFGPSKTRVRRFYLYVR
jgi:hypothetical protein